MNVLRILHNDLAQYLREALRGFKNDSADTDYQKGYQAALEEVAKVFEVSIEPTEDQGEDVLGLKPND